MIPLLESFASALGELVAGLLVLAGFVAIIRQAAYNQAQRRAQWELAKFQKSLKPGKVHSI